MQPAVPETKLLGFIKNTKGRNAVTASSEKQRMCSTVATTEWFLQAGMGA
jgi:hypothetical protein